MLNVPEITRSHYLLKMPSLLSNPRINYCCNFAANRLLAFPYTVTTCGCVSRQYSFIFASLQLDIKRITLHVFCWGSSLSIVSVRFICVAACGNSRSLLLLCNSPLYEYATTRLSVLLLMDLPSVSIWGLSPVMPLWPPSTCLWWKFAHVSLVLST